MKKLTVIAIVLAIVLFFATIICVGFIWMEGKNTPAYWCREEVFNYYEWQHEDEILAYKVEPLNATPTVEEGIEIFKVTIYYEGLGAGYIEYIAAIAYRRPKGVGLIFSNVLIAAEDIVDLDVIEFAEVVAVDEWH